MQTNPFSLQQISANLFVYGTAHALIDAICVAVVFSIFKNQMVSPATFSFLIILYNVLAFGLQVIIGFVVDILKSPRASAIIGSILTAISAFIFLYFPLLAVVLAGIGNALFHVGAGSICLNLTPQKASAPGIFVAPGAIGLMVGTLLGKSGQFIAWPFVLALAVLCMLMFFVQKPSINYQTEIPKETSFNSFELILLLILFSITVRSMVGMVIEFPWKTDMNLLVVLTVAVVAGKAVGGILADKFGWVRIACGSLFLSIPFLVFGTNSAWLAITGMFLFNFTMPVTLVIISNVLPGRPGFAFGLTCLALLIGALPAFTNLKHVLNGQTFIFVIIVLSLISLYFGLQRYFSVSKAKS